MSTAGTYISCPRAGKEIYRSECYAVLLGPGSPEQHGVCAACPQAPVKHTSPAEVLRGADESGQDAGSAGAVSAKIVDAPADPAPSGTGPAMPDPDAATDQTVEHVAVTAQAIREAGRQSHKMRLLAQRSGEAYAMVYYGFRQWQKGKPVKSPKGLKMEQALRDMGLTWADLAVDAQSAAPAAQAPEHPPREPEPAPALTEAVSVAQVERVRPQADPGHVRERTLGEVLAAMKHDLPPGCTITITLSCGDAS